MKAWLNSQRHWLRVKVLPGYAHDLSPMELVWGNLKAAELANLCPDALDEAHTAARDCIASAAATACVSTSSTHTGLRL